jgi:hypothetical protein
MKGGVLLASIQDEKLAKCRWEDEVVVGSLGKVVLVLVFSGAIVYEACWLLALALEYLGVVVEGRAVG